MAKVDRKICYSVNNCSANTNCIDVCPLHVIRNVNNMIIIGSVCVDCGECVTVCPKKAISL